MALRELDDCLLGYIVNDQLIVEADITVREISDNLLLVSKGNDNVGLENQNATRYMKSVIQLTGGQVTHISTGGEAVLAPTNANTSVVESKEVPLVVSGGEEKGITKVELAEAQISAGGDGAHSSRASKAEAQHKETIAAPEQSVTGVEVRQPQQPQDKQVVGNEVVQPVRSSVQGIPEVQIPEEVPYDAGPGHGSDLVDWLGFRVQRRSVAYLNKLVERYPDSLAKFNSRSPLVQAGHLGTVALLLYTADTIPLKAWSSTLQEKCLSYIDDLKEACIELPWLMERFSLLDDHRASFLAKVELEEWEPEAAKLKQEIVVLQTKLGMLEEKIAGAQALFKAKEHLLSGQSFTVCPNYPILFGLL
ncbi:unnamed protein product [Ilex paraguariensis]|uniref:MATH domain-containing protein n=1 Tax=Ilex paraguariensis TaxID=185542 RepID=A0ABC8V547_9AQUA